MNWNHQEAEVALAAGASLQEALRLGLPFAPQLLDLARGDLDQVQALWLWAAEAEMGGPKPEPEDGERGGEAHTYIGKAVDRKLDDTLTLLKKGMRRLLARSRKANKTRRKLESSWSYVTSKGDNGWP